VQVEDMPKSEVYPADLEANASVRLELTLDKNGSKEAAVWANV